MNPTTAPTWWSLLRSWNSTASRTKCTAYPGPGDAACQQSHVHHPLQGRRHELLRRRPTLTRHALKTRRPVSKDVPGRNSAMPRGARLRSAFAAELVCVAIFGLAACSDASSRPARPSGSAVCDDKTGDVVSDLHTEPLTPTIGAAWEDILDARLVSDGTQLTTTVTVSGDLPPRTSEAAFAPELSIYDRATGRLLWGINGNSQTQKATVIDFRRLGTSAGHDVSTLPGSRIQVSGATVSMSVPWSALRDSPKDMRTGFLWSVYLSSTAGAVAAPGALGTFQNDSDSCPDIGRPGDPVQPVSLAAFPLSANTTTTNSAATTSTTLELTTSSTGVTQELPGAVGVAPCSLAAIEMALLRAPDYAHDVQAPHTFSHLRCLQGWAVADWNSVPPSQGDAVILRAQSGVWVPVDEGTSICAIDIGMPQSVFDQLLPGAC